MPLFKLPDGGLEGTRARPAGGVAKDVYQYLVG